MSCRGEASIVACARLLWATMLVFVRICVRTYEVVCASEFFDFHYFDYLSTFTRALYVARAFGGGRM